MQYLLGPSGDEGKPLQSSMSLSQMIVLVTGSLLDLVVQQWGGVMPALLPAWHAVPRPELQVTQSGWRHLHGSCVGANKAVQWQGKSTLLGRTGSTKPSGKPQNRDPLLEAEATQAHSRSEGQVLAAALAQPQGMRQLPVPCGLWSHAEPWLTDVVAGWGKLP